jgi:hypothetical protein
MGITAWEAPVKTFRTILLACVLSLGLAAEAAAQNTGALRGQDALGQRPVENEQRRPQNDAVIPTSRAPRFIVQAISFRALDETHYSWMGSDDVFAMFSSGGRGMRTRVVGGVDSGDTERFLRTQNCIYPAIDPDRRDNDQWRCDPRGGEGPIEFMIALYEDDILPHEILGFNVCGYGPEYAGTDLDECLGHYESSSDDTLLHATLRYDVADIVPRLNPSCNCFTQTATSDRSDSRYQITFRITMVDPGGGPVLEQGPANGGGPTGPIVLRSGSLTAQLNQQFEFDGGAIVVNGGDLSFALSAMQHVLTPQNGARIWVGNTAARGYAGCSAGAANHSTAAVQVPAQNSYVCYITSDGRVGELRIGQLMPFRSLEVSYTTWQ